jgi:hypothetical protein
MPVMRRASLVGLAGLFCATILTGGVVAQQPDDTVIEEITVFESRLLADFAALPRRQAKGLEARDLVVYEDGIPRQVSNLQALPPAGQWRVVLYFDAPSSRARTLRLASLQLGEHAEALTALGPVEVVVADPAPRLVFGPSLETQPLQQELTRLAQTELEAVDLLAAGRRGFRDLGEELGPRDPRRQQYLDREEKLVRQQADHLLRFAASGCAGEPCVLFLVHDGFYERPESHYLGTERVVDPTDPPSPALLASQDLEQTLPALEWVVVTMPVRSGELRTSVNEPESTDFDRFIDHTGGVRMAPKRGANDVHLSLESLEVSALPQLQPLRKMAAASAGSTVRVVSQMTAAVERLGTLWRIDYLTDRQLDGRVRSASARLAGGGRVGTPSWIRSSTPEPLAGLRVRDRLAHSAGSGELPIRATLENEADADTSVLHVSARWGDTAELVAGNTIRVSVGFDDGAGQVLVGHTLLVGPEDLEGDSDWTAEVRLRLPPGTARVGVAIEGLVPRLWGTAVATF